MTWRVLSVWPYFWGAEPRLLPAAAFDAALDAALAAQPDLVRKIRRRPSDGALTASFIHTRAVPVASDYELQLSIYMVGQCSLT
jgi:hypothetical protein